MHGTQASTPPGGSRSSDLSRPWPFLARSPCSARALSAPRQRPLLVQDPGRRHRQPHQAPPLVSGWRNHGIRTSGSLARRRRAITGRGTQASHGRVRLETRRQGHGAGSDPAIAPPGTGGHRRGPTDALDGTQSAFGYSAGQFVKRAHGPVGGARLPPRRPRPASPARTPTIRRAGRTASTRG